MRERKENKVECRLENGVIVSVPKNVFDQVVLKMQFPDREYVNYREGAVLYCMSERKFFDVARVVKARIQYGGKILVCVKDVNKFLQSCRLDD